MFKLIPEHASRKIDVSGRISMPKAMKDRFGYAVGTELEFFTLLDTDTDETYIVFKKVEE